VHSGVRSRAADNIVAHTAYLLPGILKGLLHGGRVFLHLPAVIGAAVIGEFHKQIAHGYVLLS
jgi:hypothetical protein